MLVNGRVSMAALCNAWDSAMTQWMKQRRSLLGAALVSIGGSVAATARAAPGRAAPPPDPAMAQRIDRALALAVAQQRVVGVVALVARDGQWIYQRAFGDADREAARAMTVHTPFRLASLTKPVVTLAALRLAEVGRLRLDAPVTDYLPAFRPRLPDGSAPAITLQQLLLHTSGLGYGFAEAPRGAYARLGVSDGLDSAPVTLRDNLRRLAQAPLYFAPGTQWRYSLGIDVIGAVIEQVTAQRLPHAIDALVLRPAALQGFAFAVPRRQHLATPYADGGPRPLRMTRDMRVASPGMAGGGVVFDPARAYSASAFPSGGGGMVGTAPGYLRFLEVLRAGGAPVLARAAPADWMQPLVGPQAQTQGPGWGFGYGGAVLVDPVAAASPQSAGTLQWGGAYGHNWFIDPAQRLSVVMLTNTAFEGMSGALVTQLRDAVYGTVPAV